MLLQVLKRSERSEKMRAVAQHFFRFGHRRCPKANAGAAEGVAMEGNDRRGKTCSFKDVSNLIICQNLNRGVAGVSPAEGVAEDRECGLEPGGDFPLIQKNPI